MKILLFFYIKEILKNGEDLQEFKKILIIIKKYENI